MFRGKTTIVVGAGGGIDFGMPLGKDLTEIIARNLTFKSNDWGEVTSANAAVMDALRQYAANEELRDMAVYLTACDDIINGMREAQSIDEFIHTRRDDKRIELCGKAAIAYSILQKERASENLFFQNEYRDNKKTINFGAIQDTWVPLFRKFVTGDSHRDEIAERFQQITFIVFNYDRCIEHYLLHSLMTYHTLDEVTAAHVMESLKIIHPYGSVGSLPWQGQNHPIDFGGGPPSNLATLAEEIRTFTEQSEDSEMQESIYRAIHDSDLILFLGFAFHKQNLDLLTTDTSDRNIRIIGTAHGISDSDCDLIGKNLAVRFCGSNKNAVRLNNKHKCVDLFTQNWYRLST